MIRTQPLSEVLLGRTLREKLQQGWSPRCLTTPADEAHWGILKTTAIQAGEFRDHENKELPSSLQERLALEVRVGDLLMTCAGPRGRCGVATLVRRTRPQLMLSGKMYRFRPDPEKADPRFLEFFLLSPDAQRRIDSMKTGISDSGLNLTKDRFLNLPVPLPSISEQRRIVDILEDHLSRLDAADDTLRAARVKGDAFMRGTLDGLVWGGTTTPVPVSTLLREPMRNGHSARRARESSDGIRTLTLTAITRRSFVDAHTKITTADPDRVRDLWLEPNDILVQRANTPELVGSSAMFDGPAGWAIFPDLLIRLRPDETRVLPAYLALALQAERTHRALRSKAKGLAGSMPKVDQAAIGSTVIPLPPLKEQRQIVNEAMQTEGASTRLANELAGCMSRSQALRRSLLDAAFSGRLTGHSSDLERAEEMAL